MRQTPCAGTRPAAAPRTLVTAAAAEVTSTARAAVRWAAGFGPEIPHVPAGVPDGAVMLVHGFGSNKSHFTALERLLVRAGYAVCAVNYPWARTSLAQAGEHVAADAATFVQRVGADSLHVVGHSLGGLVARWAMGNTDLGEQIASLTTLGSPHRGTPLAHLAPRRVPLVGGLLSQLRVTSSDLVDLPHPAQFGHVPHTAICGSLDVVVPAPFATLPQAANVSNESVVAGHISMATNECAMRRTLEAIATGVQAERLRSA